MLWASLAMLCLTFVASAADISGKWVTDTSAAPAGAPAGGGQGAGRLGAMAGAGTYEFKVSGSTLTGSVARPGFQGGEATVTPIAEGKITGDKFSFSVTRSLNGTDYKTAYTGKVIGDKLELTADVAGRGTRTITLKKADQ
jgi:hypothetical protein